MSYRSELPQDSAEYWWYASIDRVVHQYDFLRLDSAWSGRAFVDRSPELRGLCFPDADGNAIIGSDLLKPAMQVERGTTNVEKQRNAYNAALKMVHTSVRLTDVDRGYRPAPGAVRGDPGAAALATGLAQAWALQNLRGVVTEADLALRSPRLTASRVINPMPHTSAAANALVKGIAGHIGRSTGPVFRELIETPTSQRFNRVADWMMKYHGLSTALPPAQRDALRAELAGLTHREFSKVAGIPDRLAAMEGGKGSAGIALRSAMTQRGVAAGGRGSLVNIVPMWMTAIDRHRIQAQTPPAAPSGPSHDPLRAAFAGQAPAAGAPVTRAGQPGDSSQTPQGSQNPQVSPQHRPVDGGRRAPGADPHAR